MSQESKADYQLLVNIIFSNSQINDVRCKIYLPKKIDDIIQILLYPTQEQVPVISAIFEFSIEGILKTYTGEAIGRIEASKVYNNQTITEYLSPEIQDSVLDCEPVDLKIVHFLNHDSNHIDSQSNANATTIFFWLTPSILLSPFQIINKNYNSGIQIETHHQFEFTISNDISLTFTKHYRFYENLEGEHITFPELVAECTVDLTSQKVENLLKYLDDFLAIVSFTTRERCVCLGWQLMDSKEYTRFYRRNLSIQNLNKKQDINETLIDKSKFKDFIETAYKSFVKFQPNILFRQAIKYSIGVRYQVLESSFTGLYSVLETLVLDYRRRNNREFIFAPSDWKKFEKQIKKWIKQQPQFANLPEQRDLMYKKLPELNRIPFSEAFEELCSSLNLDLQDLWPVSKGKASLTEIRNKFVHGSNFAHSEKQSLIVAFQHLTWIVERAILSLLGWPISDSRVSSKFLNEYMPSYLDWESERQLIANSTEEIIVFTNDAPQDEI